MQITLNHFIFESLENYKIHISYIKYHINYKYEDKFF